MDLFNIFGFITDAVNRALYNDKYGCLLRGLTLDTSTQDDHSGHRTLQESAGKSRENRQFPQENSGNQRKTEAVFQPEIVSDFFPDDSRPFPAGMNRN